MHGVVLRRVERARRQQGVQHEHVEEAHRLARDADRLERIEVHAAQLDVLHAALAQRMQRPLARTDDAFRPHHAVELVLDLQQAGRQLLVARRRRRGCRSPRTADTAASAPPPACGRSRPGRCSRWPASTAHRSGSPAAPCAARWRAAGAACPRRAAAARGAGRRRRWRTAPARHRTGTAAAARGGGRCGSGRSSRRRRPPAATSCSGCPRSSACAGRSGAPGRCGRRSWRGRCANCRSGRSECRRRRAASHGMLDDPQPLVADGAQHDLVQLDQLVHAGFALVCTPVTSSGCDSLKSVVMRGCVSAEPSAAGCGVSASCPSGRTRRLSFSMPRRMPRSASGDSARRRSCMCVMGRSLLSSPFERRV